MKFMTKEDIIVRLKHLNGELFKVEEKIYANGTLEIIISIDKQPPKQNIEFGMDISKLKGF